MDIAVNPGPRIGSTSDDELHFIHSDSSHSIMSSNSTIMYSRGQLFNIRKTSCHSIQPGLLSILKANGILRFRGNRAGHCNYKCKIPVQIGHRLDYVHNERALENRPPVFKHIVVNPAIPLIIFLNSVA